MSRPHLLIGITAACAVITLTTPKSWLRLPVLGVGFSCGFTYLLHAGIQWRRENQHVIEWSDRYLLLLKTNHSIEKSLADKQQELEELSKLTDAELDAITKERQQHITNLNNQIEELTQLLDEQLAEIDQQEQESRSLLMAEIDQYKHEQLAELEEKTLQLKNAALEDEQWLNSEIERLNSELDQAKAKFLEKNQAEIEKLSDRIDLLEEELAAAHRLLEKYEEPELPRGMDVEKVAAYKVQKFFRDKGIITYLVGAYPDEANRRVLIRLRPKTGGQSQFKKAWLNELQIQEDLPEPVGIRTVAGAVEFEVKPRTWSAFKPWDDLPPGPGTPPPPTHSNSYEFENPSPVTADEVEEFQEPTFRLRPFGKITRVEQTWIVALWEAGIKTQRVVLGTVYMSQRGSPVAKGDGNSFIQGRERMYAILDMQGFTYIRRGA